MKWRLAAALALSLTLVSCAASAGGGSGPLAAPAASAPVPQADIAQPDISQPEEEDHSQPSQADNIVPHEPVGYCGNTITTVRRNDRLVDSPWEASFWGGDSVALTDLLIHLDYSGDICRCLPEYYVKTEFSEEEYGVNLSDSYVRYHGGQVKLTREQADLIRDILDRNSPD